MDKLLCDFMLYMCRERSWKEIIQNFPEKIIYTATNQKIIIKKQLLPSQCRPKMLEIETNTLCNNCCRFCPVATHPKSKNQVMDLGLFTEIMEKAVRCGTVIGVTLHFYGEPTLDIFFEDRIKLIAQTDMKLYLHTNATYLDRKKVEILMRHRETLQVIIVNFPSADKIEYNYITGSNNYKKAYQNLLFICKMGLPIVIDVHGTVAQTKKNQCLIREEFQKYPNVYINVDQTTDRCGYIQNEFQLNLFNTNLYGCLKSIQNVVISVNGDLFLCCNDYNKQYCYGNINEGELVDLMSNLRITELRKKILGLVSVGKDLICRQCWDMSKVKFNRQKVIQYLQQDID